MKWCGGAQKPQLLHIIVVFVQEIPPNKSGTLWSEGSVHPKCATWDHFRYIILAHFEFYWLRTPWSHHLENQKKSLNKPIEIGRAHV